MILIACACAQLSFEPLLPAATFRKGHVETNPQYTVFYLMIQRELNRSYLTARDNPAVANYYLNDSAYQTLLSTHATQPPQLIPGIYGMITLYTKYNTQEQYTYPTEYTLDNHIQALSRIIKLLKSLGYVLRFLVPVANYGNSIVNELASDDQIQYVERIYVALR